MIDSFFAEAMWLADRRPQALSGVSRRVVDRRGHQMSDKRLPAAQPDPSLLPVAETDAPDTAALFVDRRDFPTSRQTPLSRGSGDPQSWSIRPVD
jgi:hypothetical protein